MKKRQDRSDGLLSRFYKTPPRGEKRRPAGEPAPMTEEERLQDLIERYGGFLDEDNEPLKGINPNPKYYVIPKEKPLPPQEELPVRPPAATPKKTVKVSPRPVRRTPARVTIRLRTKRPSKAVTVTVRAKKKSPIKVKPKRISKE